MKKWSHGNVVWCGVLWSGLVCKDSQGKIAFLFVKFDGSSGYSYGIYAYIHWRNIRCLWQTHGRTESGEKGNILLGQKPIPQYRHNNHKNRNQGHCASVKQIGPSLLLSASGQAGQVLVNFSFPYFLVSYFLKTHLDPSSLSTITGRQQWRTPTTPTPGDFLFKAFVQR